MLKPLVLFLMGSIMCAETLPEAVRALAEKITPHLSATENMHLTFRNLTSLPEAEMVKVQTALRKALPRRTHTSARVEIAITLSENAGGYLLIAEIGSADNKSVEMVSFQSEPLPPAPALLGISKRLLWQQERPILDLVVFGNEMLVLDADALVRYERKDENWVEADSTHLDAPAQRDPRARMIIEQDKVSIFFPGVTCRGAWQPVSLSCEPVNSDFPLGQSSVHFTPKRNTIEGLESSEESIPVCNGKRLASGSGEMDTEDTITLFEGTQPVSESLEMPGPVTALWPSADGVLAVVWNLSSKQYAAYALSLDCGR